MSDSSVSLRRTAAKKSRKKKRTAARHEGTRLFVSLLVLCLVLKCGFPQRRDPKVRVHNPCLSLLLSFPQAAPLLKRTLPQRLSQLSQHGREGSGGAGLRRRSVASAELGQSGHRLGLASDDQGAGQSVEHHGLDFFGLGRRAGGHRRGARLLTGPAGPMGAYGPHFYGRLGPWMRVPQGHQAAQQRRLWEEGFGAQLELELPGDPFLEAEERRCHRSGIGALSGRLDSSGSSQFCTSSAKV